MSRDPLPSVASLPLASTVLPSTPWAAPSTARRLAPWWIASVALALLPTAGWIGYQFARGEARQPASDGVLSAESLKDGFLQAAATHGNDTFAIATGSIDSNLEALYTLDFATGQLNCLVLYPQANAFGARFATNIGMFKAGGGRNNKSKYLMITGTAELSGPNSGPRPSSCVYVMDVGTGEVLAFAAPFNRSMMNSRNEQFGELVLIGRFAVRDGFSNRNSNAPQGNKNGDDKNAADKNAGGNDADAAQGDQPNQEKKNDRRKKGDG
jgi:hypothetical protein